MKLKNSDLGQFFADTLLQIRPEIEVALVRLRYWKLIADTDFYGLKRERPMDRQACKTEGDLQTLSQRYTL